VSRFRSEDFPLAAFGVHLSVGALASGVVATGLLVTGLASPGEMLAYLTLGTAGSLAPDLDADNSAPVRVVFTTLSIAAAFALLFRFAPLFPTVAELTLLWVAGFLGLRWAVFALITRLTHHRGVFHSVPAAAVFGLLTVITATSLGQSGLRAWLAGICVGLGYLVHLLLDEVYSLNLFGARAKRSLGTALKLWSGTSPGASVVLYLVLLASLLFVPSPRPLLERLDAVGRASPVSDRFWPRDGWFAPLRSAWSAGLRRAF